MREVRVQVVLRGLSAKITESQFEQLRRKSCAAGVSMSAYVRALIERDIESAKWPSLELGA